MNINFSIIIATDSKNGIGRDNGLAWSLKEDMRYYRSTTSDTKNPDKMNALIMGRKTWGSIPEKFRPLPGRLNCVLSRMEGYKDDGCLSYTSLEDCLDSLKINNKVETIFINGGAEIYNCVLDDSRLEKIYLTKVDGDFECDVFFKGVPDNFELESFSEGKEENGVKFRFEIWRKVN